MARILIIEDNQDIHALIKQSLGQDHELVSAFAGTEGLLYCQSQPVDLVLLDYMLPGMNGQAVLEAIRAFSQVPVIMLTALGDKKLISQMLLAGANDYMVKPFDFEELYARVAVQLRTAGLEAGASSQPSQAITSLGQLELQADSFEISREGQAVRLSKKEFGILTTLLGEPQRIFTKELLYELVWQDAFIPGDNTLNTHLSNLRKKISQLDDSQDYIETVWGLGVRLAQGVRPGGEAT